MLNNTDHRGEVVFTSGRQVSAEVSVVCPREIRAADLRADRRGALWGGGGGGGGGAGD
jgi:hypothetical protein